MRKDLILALTNTVKIDLPADFVAYLAEEPLIFRSFPDVEAAIDAAIARLGGVVFPKLEHAPRDATFVRGTLECRDAEDVVSLLKVSTVEGPTLYLRRWMDMHPSGEFRCFARSFRLVGACQRRLDVRFEVADVKGKIAEFYDQHLRTFEAVVFDVYVDGRVYLVDLDDFGHGDPLLFEWDEFPPVTQQSCLPTNPDSFDLRILAKDQRIVANDLAASRAPIDVIDLAQAGGLDALIDQVRRQNDEED